eukprot:7611066-Alexandrium_andersonii.AAC.1
MESCRGGVPAAIATNRIRQERQRPLPATARSAVLQRTATGACGKPSPVDVALARCCRGGWPKAQPVPGA